MKTYVWSFPTRLFHLLLALSFTVAYVLGDFDELRRFHFAFGAFVGTLIGFRLLYGLIGPKYSNFKDFPIGLSHQKGFISTFFSTPITQAGHNPLASLVMIAILLVGIGCSLTGFTLYAAENELISMSRGEGLLGEIHEVLANLFLLLVGIHLLGVLVDFIFHRATGTLKSIVTGYKTIEGENTKLSTVHRLFSVAWLVVPFIVFYLAMGLHINNKEEKKRDKQPVEIQQNH